jgi:hypothetical protein
LIFLLCYIDRSNIGAQIDLSFVRSDVLIQDQLG